jgi:hypothetical protein
MDNKIEKFLDELGDFLAKKLDDNNIEKMFNDKLEKALNEDVTIHVDGDKDYTSVMIKGSRTGLLMRLAVAEKEILQKLNCDNEEFELFKNVCGTKTLKEIDLKAEDKNNE